MGFFSRKSTTTKTNEFAAVADSGNCSISNDTIGDVRSSPSYTPPPEGGGEIGAQTQPSISSQPPQPVGYKMDPAGDGSEYVDADLVTPETTTATTTGGESVPADDKEGQDATIPTNLDAADATDDDKEVALPQKVPFDGIKGVIQAPKYKDLKYFIFFVLHFGITIWWFVDSFIPVSRYLNHNWNPGEQQRTHTKTVSNSLSSCVGWFVSAINEFTLIIICLSSLFDTYPIIPPKTELHLLQLCQIQQPKRKARPTHRRHDYPQLYGTFHIAICRGLLLASWPDGLKEYDILLHEHVLGCRSVWTVHWRVLHASGRIGGLCYC